MCLVGETTFVLFGDSEPRLEPLGCELDAGSAGQAPTTLPTTSFADCKISTIWRRVGNAGGGNLGTDFGSDGGSTAFGGERLGSAPGMGCKMVGFSLGRKLSGDGSF